MSETIASGISNSLTTQKQQDAVDNLSEAVATTSKSGFMSSTDKTKLDGLTPVPSGVNVVGAITIAMIPYVGVTSIAAGSTISGSDLFRTATPTGNSNPVLLNMWSDNDTLKAISSADGYTSLGLTGTWRVLTGVYSLNTFGAGTRKPALVQKIA